MIRRRQLIGSLPAAAALLATLPAGAATPDDLSAPPPAGPPHAVTVPPLHESRLDNGVNVVVAPRRGLPLVSAWLLVRVGAETDPLDRAGRADMLAALLTQGARRDGRAVSAPELARQAEALGGSLSASSGWRATSLGMTVTTPRLDAALSLMSDVLRQPTLAADEMDRLRVQAVDALKVSNSDPGSIASRVARRLYWGGSAYGGVSTEQTLQRLRRDDLQALHAQGFRPEDTLLVLAGDLTPERGLALAQQHLGSWRPSRIAPLARRDGRPAPLAPRTVLVNLPGVGQSSVTVLAPFTSLAPDDVAELRIGQVANAVLGGGYSARLNQEVRIKRGLSYGVGTSAEQHAEGGLWEASAQTDHRNAAQVAELLRAQVLGLATTPPTADELAARQATLVGGFARRLDTNAGIASLITARWASGRPLSELDRFVQEVLAVTPGQVQEFARRRWPASDLRTVVVGDFSAAPEVFDALAAADASTLRLQAGELDFGGPGLQQAAAR
ncbi:M16 family metallopeptidase [Aquincola tertiaricarbonis]|uniref:M16 family metallopeptidase n=1 Tax=Aquincola tertiaricarbonis TaxID=391953 RepID=UPI0006153501|nr:pitrilysin family protein [Aquincola tertiaricarbonis]